MANTEYRIVGGYNNGVTVWTRSDAERLAREQEKTHGRGKVAEVPAE